MKVTVVVVVVIVAGHALDAGREMAGGQGFSRSAPVADMLVRRIVGEGFLQWTLDW